MDRVQAAHPGLARAATAPVHPGQAASGTPADRVGDPGHHARLTGSPGNRAGAETPAARR
jgi:hypothetical protein